MDFSKIESYSPSSKVWIYTSDKEFNSEQVPIIASSLNSFVKNWTAHSKLLQSTYLIAFNRFIILIVDESKAGASGCSIDASVRFMKGLGEEFGLDFFNRMLFAYKEGEKAIVLDKENFEKSIRSGNIHRETLVFNNLVRNKEELGRLWIVPLKESWFGDYFAQPLKKETWS